MGALTKVLTNVFHDCCLRQEHVLHGTVRKMLYQVDFKVVLTEVK